VTPEIRQLTAHDPEWSGNSVSAGLTLDGRGHVVHFAADALPPVEADFLLPAALIPAMTADRLEVAPPVSPRLLSSVPLMQEIFSSWSKLLAPVPVVARPYDLRRQPPGGVACFFSGGVDSFYTVLRQRDEISHLIFLHGYDIPLEGHDGLRSKAVAAARSVAADLNLTLVELETDIRAFSEPVVPWMTYYLAVLASAALVLGGRFSRVLIPSGVTYADPVGWGTHPLVDPLWSTETTEIVHAGAEARRIAKLAYVAQHDLALRWLRVCWENPNGEYNCGRCEKCLRTMIGLRAAGALDRCETLPSEIDLRTVAAMELDSEYELRYARENREALERLGTEPALVDAIREAEERTEGSYQRVHEAEQRAADAERALADLRLTRRYRFARAIARPLDAARATARRRRA
jgi:hypothetical protein